MLAGVGVTWYTWLEQGRDINASVQVLDAVAATLRMDGQERYHLLQLAGVAVASPRSPSQCVGISADGQAVLDQLDPFPAVALSQHYDILAYNRAYNWLAGDLDAIDVAERNHLWLFFTHLYWQDVCRASRTEAGAHLVADLRANIADQLDDPMWTDLVERLRNASAEFETLWLRHDVVDRGSPAKDFDSPGGDLRLQLSRFGVGDLPGGARMMVYSPRDEATRERLSQMVSLDATRRFRAV